MIRTLTLLLLTSLHSCAVFDGYRITGAVAYEGWRVEGSIEPRGGKSPVRVNPQK